MNGYLNLYSAVSTINNKFHVINDVRLVLLAFFV